MKQIVFIALIIVFFMAVAVAIQYQEIFVSNAVWLILLAVFLILIWRYDFLLQLEEYERAVISRFGKINRVSGPGWCLMLPPFETYKKVDLRTTTLDMPKQEVITKDLVHLSIDAVIYIKVKKDNQSVINSVIEVKDYNNATILYVIAKTRDVIGSMTFENVISNIEELNVELKKGIEEISKDWGIACESVEIKDVDVPDSVMQAMHRSKAATQDKFAREEQAKGHMAEINAVRDAAEHLNDRALAYYYIKALEKLGEGKSTKFIFPMEISALASSLSSRISGSQKKDSDVEALFKQYAPALMKIVNEKELEAPKGKKKKK